MECLYRRQGFLGSSAGKESICNAGDLGSIAGLGRALEEGMATHSSILAWRIPMDRGAWWATWGHKESDIAETTEHTHRRQYGDFRKSSQKHNPLTVHPLSFLIMSNFLVSALCSSLFPPKIKLTSTNSDWKAHTSTALPLLESLNFNLGLLIASEPLLYWCDYYY